MKDEEKEEIKRKRVQTLLFATKLLAKKHILDGENYILNNGIMGEMVDTYCEELETVKKAYNIKARVNPAKIAGIMASLIVRYKPWVSKQGDFVDTNNQEQNEILAIFHGLILCSIQGDGTEGVDTLKNIFESQRFNNWLQLFKQTLRKQNYSTEMLILVFESIRSYVFLNTK